MGLHQEDFPCLGGRKKEEITDGYIEKILKEGNTFGEGESSLGEPSSVRKPESVSKVSSLQIYIYILLYQGKNESGKNIKGGIHNMNTCGNRGTFIY